MRWFKKADNEDDVRELADKIEKSNIKWIGMDASLEVSIGEYAVFFPEKELLLISKGNSGWAYTNDNIEGLKQTVMDTIENSSKAKEFGSFIGETKEEILKELSIDYQVVDICFALDKYFGTFSEGGNYLGFDDVYSRLDLKKGE